MMAPESPSLTVAGVDAQNPWPGLESFRENDASFFHGRDQEAEELLRLVKRERLTVLFSRSGLGKTSLLRAGLFPKLRAEEYLPLYIRLDYGLSAEAPEQQVKAAIARAIEAGECEAPEASPQQSLWEYFHGKNADFWSRQNSLLMPVLVFDQFEEIFTLGRRSDALRKSSENFLTQLADLIENRPPAEVRQKVDSSDSEATSFTFGKEVCKIVLSLREDYLPELEGLRPLIPSVMTNRLRIEPMSGDQAFAVVFEPAPNIVSRKVATQIVRFVAAAAGPSGTSDDGGASLKDLEIDPALLSLFCRKLNDQRIALSEPAITTKLVGGSSREILTKFYEDCIGAFAPEARQSVRNFIEDCLLTKSGHRDNMALENALEEPGINQGVLEQLIGRRLLRFDERQKGQPRVELAHDVLIGVISASRDVRYLQQKEAAERARAEQERRDAEAKAAAEHERAEREKEEKERAEALVQRAAEARAQADEIISFLIYQLRDKLSTIGQVQLLADVNDKAIEYFEKLGSDEQTPDVEWNKAVALQSRGHIRVDAGRIAEAADAHHQSLAIFRKLAESPDANETHFYGLATECSSLSWTLLAQGRTDEARVMSQEALDIAVRWAAKENAEFKWATFVPFFREGLANILRSQGKLEEAIKCYEENRHIHEAARAANANDELSLGAIASTYIVLGDALRARGELEPALKYFQQSLTIRKQLAEDKPADVTRQHNVSQAYDRVGEALQASGRINESWAAFNESDGIFRRLAMSDPDNANWQRNYSVTRFRLAESQSMLGFSSSASNIFSTVLEFREKLAALDGSNAEARDDLAEAHLRVGDSAVLYGQLTEAGRHYDEALKLRTALAEDDPTNADRSGRLADAIERVGDLQLFRREAPAALQSYLHASEIRKALSENDITNRMRLSDLADSQLKVGDAHKLQDDNQQALQIYLEALAIRQTLSEGDTANVQWQSRLAVTLGKLGEAGAALGDMESASRNLFAGLRVLTKLTALSPQNAEWEVESADLGDAVSEVALALGRVPSALENLRVLLPVREKLAEPDEKNFKRHAELARTLYLTSKVLFLSEASSKTEAAQLLLRASSIMGHFRGHVELTYEQQQWLTDIEAAVRDRDALVTEAMVNSPFSAGDKAAEASAASDEPPESSHSM